MPRLAKLLDHLESFHGIQTPNWPTDPYLFLIWWQCGYPASDTACAKGWESLQRISRLDPERLLSASPAKLAKALEPGGMMPELRAMRLQEIAERVTKEFNCDLRSALNGLSVAQVRAAFKKFPGIANPGVDRILLFGAISPVAAIPSNSPQVLVRIWTGVVPENYNKSYAEAQRILSSEIPEKFDARTRTYLLLKAHGQTLCKRSNPKCDSCPIANQCAFASGKLA
jgi:endonuclease III